MKIPGRIKDAKGIKALQTQQGWYTCELIENEAACIKPAWVWYRWDPGTHIPILIGESIKILKMNIPTWENENLVFSKEVSLGKKKSTFKVRLYTHQQMANRKQTQPYICSLLISYCCQRCLQFFISILQILAYIIGLPVLCFY